jgi:hypothetical protein
MYKQIIASSKWSESHGAVNNFAGMGGIYYALTYTYKAKKCVCLGSGGGFVPKLMHLAQQTLIDENIIKDFDISLIDADIGIWGRPVYGESIPYYPQIKLIKKLTDDAFDQFENIDYLHVDADHTHDQVYKDLSNYGSKMNKKYWAITVHDTNNLGAYRRGLPIGCYSAAKQWASEHNHDMINFPIGEGTALILPRIGC